jgi:signal transduction histidine kinase
MRRFPQYLRWLLRELRICVPIAFGAAWFISAMFRESFRITLIYSLCIGVLIQALIQAGRYSLMYVLRKRSVGVYDPQYNWPGWGLMGPWIFVAGSVGYFAGHLLGDLFTGLHRAPGVFQNPRAVFMVLAIVFARGRMAVMEARAQTAMRSAAENQLKMLESQLEPHMLFNTLANLRVLIGVDPLRAQEMLDQIISFLRATLEASRSASHPLSLEFTRINDYLAMMQVRMGSRLHFHLDLPADLAMLSVPPLLLQPLVENAIKHGLEPKVAGGRIDVKARCEDKVLILTVRDTGAGLSILPGNGTNFGMQQVRERIRNLYGNDATLELIPAGDDEGGVLAAVRLPLASLTLATSLSKP